MSEAICLHYEKRPSAIIGLAKAFWGISRRYNSKTDSAELCALWENVAILPDHLNKFNEICGLETIGRINLFYPLTLVFPLVIRVLGHSRAPLTIFRSLNTKTRIIKHREIGADEMINVSCRMDKRRVIAKGLEVDLVSLIERQGETLWECVQTFLFRGRYGASEPDHESTDMVAIPDAPVIGKWFLPEGLGFRFAKISGDSNGIHYNARYAKIFGFERDFAQPMLVLPKAVGIIPESIKSNRLDICFKGPIYYDRQIYVRGMMIDNGFRFNVYIKGNPRPCICGLMGNINK